MTIGTFATQALKAGKSAQETLALVKKVFPKSQTSIKCIYYYASKAQVRLKKAQEINQAELEKALESMVA